MVVAIVILVLTVLATKPRRLSILGKVGGGGRREELGGEAKLKLSHWDKGREGGRWVAW